jgi:hypothetical protein
VHDDSQLVRADVGNATRETVENNNLVAFGPIPVTVRTFPAEGGSLNGVLTPGARSAYFAINVPAGRGLLLNLGSQSTAGAAAIYVSTGAVPSAQQHDQRAPEQASTCNSRCRTSQ